MRIVFQYRAQFINSIGLFRAVISIHALPATLGKIKISAYPFEKQDNIPAWTSFYKNGTFQASEDGWENSSISDIV